MADALDAAIIATAAQLSTNDMTQQEASDYLEDFLSANLDEEHTYDVDVVSINIDMQKSRVSAEVRTDVPMTLMRVAGWDIMPVSVTGGATYGVNDTEVAMTFDVTGSMAGSKLSDLKAAASLGIDELLAANTPTRTPIRISVIPYAEAVNAGFLAGYAEKPGNGGSSTAYAPDDCLTERPGKFQYTDDGPEKGPPFRDSRLNRCPTTALQPLTSDKGLLANAIGKMTAGGYTAGHIGIQWAWYMISPNWASVLPAESKPLPHGSEVNKFAVIMSDGEFNTAFEGVPKSENPNRQNKKSQNSALKLCTNMKADGIRVFTIGFALKDQDAISTLKQCASPDTAAMQFFYSAASGEELKVVYQRIAELIRSLRLTY